MLVSNLEVSGSIKMHGGGITGSLLGTSSFTITSSYAQSASFIVGGSTDSASYATSASYAETASYAANVPETASYALTSSIAVSSSYALSALSASYAFDSNTALVSYTASYVNLARTASIALNAFTASFFGGTASVALSSSYALTASYAANVPETSSYALTSSIAISSSISLTASLAVSAAYAGNANLFQGNQPNVFINTGSSSGNQNLTGSLTITENLVVLGSSSFAFITASQVLLSQNTLTVYGSGSAVPLAGYKAEDTSSQYASGSLLFSLPDQNWIFNKPLIVSGGLIISGAVTASLDGTASWAVSASNLSGTASFAYTASRLDGTASFAATASTLNGTASFAYTASNLAGTASWAQVALTASYISGALSDTAATASWATYSISASYLSGSTAIVESLTVTGTASISYLSATIISASVTTGSNIFGSSNNDIHQFTGSVSITGSLTMNNSPINAPQITGSLDGTASYAITASYVLGGTETASYALTASFVATASYIATASYVATASYIETASYAITASYIATASYALTSSWATNSLFLEGKDSATFINTGSSGAVQAITGSLIITEGLTVLGSASISFITASQTVLNQNKLVVFTSGTSVPIGGYVVADTSSWDGTGSYTNTGSLLFDSTYRLWELSNNLNLTGSLPYQGLIQTNYLTVRESLTVLGLIYGTASRAITASYLDGGGASETSSYAISAYQKRFITGNEFHIIHHGHQAKLKDVYNAGTYSLDAGTWNFNIGTSSLPDNAQLEVETFYNNGIVFNNGDFTTVNEPETYETSGSNKFGNLQSNVQQLTGSVGITGSLDIFGDVSADSNLLLGNGLTVGGGSNFFGNVFAGQDVEIIGGLNVNGTVGVNGTVIALSDVLVNSGSLVVANTSTLYGDVSTNGNVNVLQNINLDGNLRAGNELTDNHRFTGSVGISGSTFSVFSAGANAEFQVGGTGVTVGNLLTDNHRFTGSVGISGSTFSVFSAGTIPEFQVGGTGVTIGNILTDNHLVTGSVGVTGSFTVFSRSNPEFRVVDNGTFIGNVQADTHRITGSVGITGSLAVVGGGITSSLQGTSSWAQTSSFVQGAQSNVPLSPSNFSATITPPNIGANWRINNFFVRRPTVGWAEIDLTFIQDDTPAGGQLNGSGDYILFLPSGVVFDTSPLGAYTPITTTGGFSTIYATSMRRGYIPASGIIGTSNTNIVFGILVYSANSFRVILGPNGAGSSGFNQVLWGGTAHGVALPSVMASISCRFKTV